MTTAAFFRHLIQLVGNSSAVDYWLLDDGSIDGTSELIQEQFECVRIVRLDGTAYWGGSLNQIKLIVEVQYSPEDIVLVCNDDIRLPDHFLKTGLSLLKEADVICPGSFMVDFDSTEAAFSCNQPCQPNWGFMFEPRAFKFLPMSHPGTANLGETFAMLSKAWVWRRVAPIPNEIPHYLSDYWLTHSFSRAGASILKSLDYYCFVCRATTRNKGLDKFKELTLEVSPPTHFRDSAKAILVYLAQGFYFVLSSLRDSTNPLHPSYRRAFIRFRQDFSAERLRAVKVLWMRISYFAVRSLVRVADQFSLN